MAVGKKILITGGYGNLGSWLTEHFYRQGYEVAVLTRNIRNLEWDIKPEIIQCNIADEADVQAKLGSRSFNYVIHTAGVNDAFVDNYANLALDINVKGTKNIIDHLQLDELKNFIYFSTFHVYGKQGRLHEELVPAPKNDYGLSHLCAELYIQLHHTKTQMPFTNIRMSNSYGCPKDYNSSKWYLILNDLSRMAFRDKKIVLKTNGLVTRDFIWMGHVCEVMQRMVEMPASNTLYNLSSGQSFSLLDIAKDVQEAYREWKGEDIEVITNTEDKNKYDQVFNVDSEKLKGFIPYKTERHFKSEAIKIFEFLNKE